MIIVFENSTGTCFVYIAVVLGQPAGLSKEVCLHSGADWINIKLLCQSEAGGIVQELCESRGGRPGLSVLTSLLVSVDVKLY